MCLYPTLLLNPKYKPNKKNGGKPPPLLHSETKYIPAPCGKCMQCMKQQSNNWKIRLTEEIKSDNKAMFVTLTFSDQAINQLSKELNQYSGYTLDNQIATLAVRRFLERIRKKTKKSIKHWLITEIGHNGTENIHLHGLLWIKLTNTELTSYWKYGFTWSGYSSQPTYISPKTINYITKYITKIDLKHTHYKPKILTSKGIGKYYILTGNNTRNKYNHQETKETYKTETGHEISLPTYYKNLTYTDEQKEQLWIHKIEKQIRYLGNKKFYMPTESEQYFKTLEYYQQVNKQLGYGTNEKLYHEKQYQETLRDQRNEARKQKALNFKKNVPHPMSEACNECDTIPDESGRCLCW